DLQGLLRSALMARAARPRQLVGLSDAREGARLFYDEAVRTDPAEHSVRRYLRVLEAFGIPIPDNPEFPMPQGALPADFRSEEFILVAPAARGAGKSLPPAVLEAVCRRLAPHPVVLAGPPGPAPALPHIRNWLGRTSLLELVGLIRAARAVLSVDSAPAHIAAAVGRPLLAIHTWSDPRKVGPFCSSALVWQGGEIREPAAAPGGAARLPDEADAELIARQTLALAGLDSGASREVK
ncbi:MAG: glycosyltransferase family 9 protein, partial [Terrimicrobiaceae bacterium]|nr:glycosyltransferase family 9 protein [Terrimicrobiaceae bacterium]